MIVATAGPCHYVTPTNFVALYETVPCSGTITLTDPYSMVSDILIPVLIISGGEQRWPSAAAAKCKASRRIYIRRIRYYRIRDKPVLKAAEPCPPYNLPFV